MPVEDYVRNARVTRVVDGDTLEVEIDLGFHTWVKKRIRVLGVDTPEIKGETRDAGIAAAKATRGWVASACGDIQIRTHLDKVDSFGRILAEIWSGKESLGRYLIEAGHAVAYLVRKAK